MCDYSYAYMFLKGKVTIVRLASHEQEKDAAAQGATVAFINKYKDLWYSDASAYKTKHFRKFMAILERWTKCF